MTTQTIKAFGCSGKGELLKPFTYTPRPLAEKDIEIEISHCGICGSDIHTLDSGWGPTTYPCVVGHEIIGTVTAAGPKVADLKVGDRVGVGAQAWACLECNECKKGHDNFCAKGVFTYNSNYADGEVSRGGYASHVRVQEEWAFRIPENLSSEVAAPLMCAGVTVFAPLSRAITRPGMNVGVVGIGGLGHLALQFANKLGANVFAISHSPNKKEECLKLGATDFIVLENKDDYERIRGNLDVLLISSFYAHESADTLLQTLAPYGNAILVAIPEDPIAFRAFSLVMGNRSLSGSIIGSVGEVKRTLEFAAAHDVKPWIEVMPMEQANEAVAKVRAGKPRFRIVLEKTANTFVDPAFSA
ncbi:hypothetical protein HDU97_002693 [Phlyctochytrium planicorne]|nr:hypothetical protein HDU97_002693 [Phlyctochytrium planicorne]